MREPCNSGKVAVIHNPEVGIYCNDRRGRWYASHLLGWTCGGKRGEERKEWESTTLRSEVAYLYIAISSTPKKKEKEKNGRI